MRDIDSIEWEGSTDDDLEFIKMFGSFARGKMSSTYKPVFLKCLLDVRHYVAGQDNDKLVGSKWVHVKGDKIILDLDFIATRFLKYYWDMEYSFKFRQSSDRQDANIRRIVQRLGMRKDKKPPTRAQLANDENATLRQEVIRRSIKPEVMVHIKTNMKNLFQTEGRSTCITLNRNIIDFFNRHYGVVSNIINHKMVTELEKYNKMTPRIATKVSHDTVMRPTLPKEDSELILWNQSDDCCFYCKRPREQTHFDHVIPFNYVYSNDIYNIVASCQKCNCTKHDRLPEEDLFGLVIDRNSDLESIVREHSLGITDIVSEMDFGRALSGMSEYTEDQYRALYDSCAATYSGREKFRPDLIAG